MPVNQTPEVLRAARLLGPALGRKASDPGTLRLAAAVLGAEPAKGDESDGAIYAIQTAKGYLAVYGNAHWFDSTPRGWALFSSEEAARNVAEVHHGAIGTQPEEGYRIVRADLPIAHRSPWPEPQSLAEL